VLDRLEAKIQNISMPRKVINREFFNDTKVIQQFEIRSTLILYNQANENLKKIIFNKNELNTYNMLINYFGGLDQFKDYCSDMIAQGLEDSIRYHGERDYQCVTPWMAELMNLRLKGFPGIQSDKEKKKVIGLYNKIHRILFKNAEWDRVLNSLGEENYLMLVKVAGFRKGDDGALDEDNETTSYVSDSLGVYDNIQGAGIFRDFMNLYGISSYQMNANFFSEGF
jgi:hypothetical protein